MLLLLRRSVVLPTKPPCYAGYSDGGSVLGYPLSDYKFQYFTLSTHRKSYVLMKRTVRTPTKLIRLNRATGSPSSFSLFFSICLSFLSVFLGYGKPSRVNNGKVNTQVQALTKLGRRLQSPDKGTGTEKPCERGFVSAVVWDLKKIGQNSTNTT